MHRLPVTIVADESGERTDTRTRTDQNHRRFAWRSSECGLRWINNWTESPDLQTMVARTTSLHMLLPQISSTPSRELLASE